MAEADLESESERKSGTGFPDTVPAGRGGGLDGGGDGDWDRGEDMSGWDSGDGIAGWYGGGCEESSNTDGGGDFSSLLSSSVSFSSSSELSSTAVSSTGTLGAALGLAKDRRVARKACQSCKMMRTKSKCRKAGDASPPFGRMVLPFSVEETDGRREDGRDGDALRESAGARREDAEDRMLGLTSAGDE